MHLHIRHPDELPWKYQYKVPEAWPTTNKGVKGCENNENPKTGQILGRPSEPNINPDSIHSKAGKRIRTLIPGLIHIFHSGGLPLFRDHRRKEDHRAVPEL